MKDISYGVRELQARLGQALRAVERGDRVIVTSRGRPIATILKSSEPDPGLSPLARKLGRLAAEGKLILGSHSPIADYEAPPIAGLSQQMVADRR